MKHTLKMAMGFIVENVFINVGNDENQFLEELYKIVENEFNINFDSKRFYLLSYKLINTNKLFFVIDRNRTPHKLLTMILGLIVNRRMEENIKNKAYLIHFRDFRDNVHLEDDDNELRREMFVQAHGFVRNSMTVRVFLVRKLLAIRNKLAKTGDENEELSLLQQQYRINCILGEIEAHTLLVGQGR